MHRVRDVIAEGVQRERASVGDDRLAWADREPCLADLVMLAARESTDPVQTPPPPLEPAGTDVVVEQLRAHSVSARLAGREVSRLVVGLRLQGVDVRHRSKVAEVTLTS